ncbi:MAG: hypothetical protein JETCAE03_32470 [Ignavibacteriaceae bacterium]|nr:MAG: hypothetical protein JETCAE03_32470 [Ignavibacteriaceae bacterium]
MGMDSKDIKKIMGRWLLSKKYNVVVYEFSGRGIQAADIFGITSSGYMYEYEVKTSVRDFKADFKKRYKHEVLKGEYQASYHYSKPNYFYYAVPSKLISVEDIPEYAGLIYVKYSDNYMGWDVDIIKEAPKLHKEKANEKLYKSILRNLSCKQVFNCKSWKNYRILNE